MFKALMTVQWKWSRGVALLATILGFAVPIASMQLIESTDPGGFVRDMQQFGVVYAVLAAGVGLAFAMFAWGSDHKGRHVYALSLPVSRARYAAMKFASGLIFLVVPAAGVLVGCLIASVVAPIPPGLHAYPFSLTLRFFFASCVAFSMFFAVASSTPKAAGAILAAIATVFVAQFLISTANSDFDLLSHVADLIFTAPGVLSVFTGRWMLIDV